MKTGQVEKIPVLDRAPGEEGNSGGPGLPPGRDDLSRLQHQGGRGSSRGAVAKDRQTAAADAGREQPDGAFVRTGHIVYAEGPALFAVAVDDQFHPLGEAIPLIQGIQNNEGSYASVAVSDNGTVVYIAGSALGAYSRLGIVDGCERHPPFHLSEREGFSFPRFSEWRA